MYFYWEDNVFLLYVYVWLPWLRVFRAFSSVVRQMPGKNPQIRGTARTVPSCCVVLCIFLCSSIYCLFCVVLCIVCVYMCTVLLPPGGYTIVVKCIISYLSYIISLTNISNIINKYIISLTNIYRIINKYIISYN
jgi:hypothetical protein